MNQIQEMGDETVFPSELKRYQLVESLKVSRFGVTVFKAIPDSPPITVALKTIPFGPSTPPETCLALIRGAEASLSLPPHPNLLRPLHFFFDPALAKFCVVLPFVPSGSMATELDVKGRLPERAVSAILREALMALAHLHSLGFSHGDIKPSNLIVDLSKPTAIYLSDFGSSTSVHHPADNTDGNGSDEAPYWIAPEALRSPRDFTEMADIWAVGVTALELLYGWAPLSRTVAPSEAAKLKIQARLDMITKNVLFSSSSGFKKMVESCLKENPTERPTANELLQYQFFENESVDGDEVFLQWVIDHSLKAKESPMVAFTAIKEQSRIASWVLNTANWYLVEVVDDGQRKSTSGPRSVRRVGTVEAAKWEAGRVIQETREVETGCPATEDAARWIEAAEMGRVMAENYALRLIKAGFSRRAL